MKELPFAKSNANLCSIEEAVHYIFIGIMPGIPSVDRKQVNALLNVMRIRGEIGPKLYDKYFTAALGFEQTYGRKELEVRLEKNCAIWKNRMEKPWECPYWQLWISLDQGAVKAYGALNGIQLTIEIPSNEWTWRCIDWENCSLNRGNDKYVQIQVDFNDLKTHFSEPLFDFDRDNRLLKKTSNKEKVGKPTEFDKGLALTALFSAHRNKKVKEESKTYYSECIKETFRKQGYQKLPSDSWGNSMIDAFLNEMKEDIPERKK